MDDVLAKQRKEREKAKEKVMKCPFCQRNDLKGIRSLSQHIHTQHDAKDKLTQQRGLVISAFGSGLVKRWLTMMTAKTATKDDLKNVIPSAVKKYYYMLKKADKLPKVIDVSKKTKNNGKAAFVGKKEKEIKALHQMNVDEILGTLVIYDQDLPVGVDIVDLNSFRFIADMIHNETLDSTEMSFNDINLKLKKKIKPSRIGKDCLTVGMVVKFLSRKEIDGGEHLYINTREGGAKLVKIRKSYNGNAVVFEFKYDEKYYQDKIDSWLKKNK